METVETALAEVNLPKPPREVRKIHGLHWAELRDQGPFQKTRIRKSAHRKGLAYERKIGRVLRDMVDSGELIGELVLSQWFLFADNVGTNWAQTDAYLLTEERILLMEVKLTQTDSVVPQLLSLYLPLLRFIYDKPVTCLQICKNLRYVPKKLVESPRELLANSGPGVWTWHCPV